MDFNKLMEQAKSFQENMQKAQGELADVKVTGEAAAGLVKVTLNGRHDCESVEIDDNIMADFVSDDADKQTQAKTVLQDLLAAAINDANQKVESATKAKMQSMTQGMNIPGFPFGQS